MEVDKKAKVEDEEEMGKRAAEDEADEWKTVKFIRKLNRKERKKRGRGEEAEDGCVDEVGEERRLHICNAGCATVVE